MIKKTTVPAKPAVTKAVPAVAKPTAPEAAAPVAGSKSAPAAAVEPKKIDLAKPLIKEAIAQGKAIIKDGKSKADAARAIYALIKDESKEIIVAVFVEGATLTPKGALTYWYNCKRRAAKESRVQNAS